MSVVNFKIEKSNVVQFGIGYSVNNRELTLLFKKDDGEELAVNLSREKWESIKSIADAAIKDLDLS